MSDDDTPQMGSPRGLGLLFAFVFALVGVWPMLFGGEPRLWSLGVAAAFLAVALIAPMVLQPFNRLWHRFGLLLAWIMTPVIMTVVYLIAVVPTGLLLRLFGRDAMRRRREPKAKSYWIERKHPIGSMRDQF